MVNAVASDREHGWNKRVAETIRATRMQRGFTQTDLARSIGVTSQQMHKIETGQSAITVGRLFTIAEILEVEPVRLLEAVDQAGERKQPSPAPTREVWELARLFRTLPDDRTRQAVTRMIRAIGKSESQS